MREAEIDQLKKDMDDMAAKAKDYTQFDPIEDVRRDIEKSIGDLPSLDQPATSTTATTRRDARNRRGAICRHRGRRHRARVAAARRADRRGRAASRRRRRSPSPRSPTASPARGGRPHDDRARRSGDRGQQGAADGAPDRAALAADQGAVRVLRDVHPVLHLRQADLQRAGVAVRLGRRARRIRSSSTRRCSNISSPSSSSRMFGAAFLSFPVVATQIYMFVAPGLYRHERSAFVPYLVATPILLRARRDGGLFPGDADAGAVLARHAAAGRAKARPRSRCCPRSANICR